MSLRGRFSAAASAIALVTVSGSLSGVWLAYCAGQQRQLDGILLRQADAEAREASYAQDPPGSGRMSLSSDPREVGRYAVIYGAAGEPLAWTPNLNTARPRMRDLPRATAAPFDLWWNNEHLRGVLLPIPERHEALLWRATPRTDLDDDARDLARRMAAAVLVAVAASAVLAWWFARVLTRDLDRIAGVARAVTGGDLAARIGPGSGDPEMTRLGADVDEMISRLAMLLESQRRFIANASHELRSPLTRLLGELSFAMRRERTVDEYREAIGEALDSARSLRELAEDLLTLARVGASDLARETVSLDDAARAALELSRAAADATAVTLERACDGAVVEGHRGDLERLVRNLVENAVRHSPPGGRVRVEARASLHEVCMTVSDEGPGVSHQVRERIFEPFFRSAADRADPRGAGLGLCIGRSIARAHGGDLAVEDSERGARFVLRLPRPAPGR